MSRRRILLLTLVTVIVVTGGVFFWQRSQSEQCPILPATEADFDQAVAIGEGVFEPERWELKTLEHQALISVGWFEHDIEALAHVQLLLYNCGYTQAEVDNFYGEANMNVMLGGYLSHTLTAQCTHDGLTLREYDVDYDGQPYKVRFWIEPLNETRVRDVHLGFFPEDIAEMEEYARRLYPDLPSCV
jgi:hypothetical protein